MQMAPNHPHQRLLGVYWLGVVVGWVLLINGLGLVVVVGMCVCVFFGCLVGFLLLWLLLTWDVLLWW